MNHQGVKLLVIKDTVLQTHQDMLAANSILNRNDLNVNQFIPFFYLIGRHKGIKLRGT